jgi:hypothetical protein
VTLASVLRPAGLALILCGSVSGAGLAQNAPAAAKPPPKPDAGTTSQPKCIYETDTFEMHGNRPSLVIALENKCEQRITCRVFAYVTSAKGAAQGRGLLKLAPKSHGAAAKKAYVMRVKMLGGSSQSTRECREG